MRAATRSNRAEPPADTMTSSPRTGPASSQPAASASSHGPSARRWPHVGGAVARDAQAFVALDAHQPHRGLARSARASASASSCVRARRCGRRPRRVPAAPRTPAPDAAWRARPRSGAAVRASRRGTPPAGLRSAPAAAPARPGRPCGLHLVGDQRPPHAGQHAQPQLEHRGEGDAPGAGVELAAEQLRRHRRLAVRRQVEAALARKGLHPGQVVRQRGLASAPPAAAAGGRPARTSPGASAATAAAARTRAESPSARGPAAGRPAHGQHVVNRRQTEAALGQIRQRHRQPQIAAVHVGIANQAAKAQQGRHALGIQRSAMRRWRASSAAVAAQWV
jgi:hypothetical protein